MMSGGHCQRVILLDQGGFLAAHRGPQLQQELTRRQVGVDGTGRSPWGDVMPVVFRTQQPVVVADFFRGPEVTQGKIALPGI